MLKTICDAMREFREEQNITISQFSKENDVPEEYVLFLESGSSDVTIDDMIWYIEKLNGVVCIKFERN